MKILAIETSCDDTCIAILEISKTGYFNILSNIVSSQIEVHKKYGGVFPAMAKREHQRNLIPSLKLALKEAGLLKIFNFQFSIFNKFSMIKFSNIKNILEKEAELAKKIIQFLEKYEKPDAEGSEPSRRIDLIAVTQGPGLEPCLWVGVNFAKALSCFWNIPIAPVNHIEAHILVNFLEIQAISYKLQELFPAVCLVVSGGHTQLILMKGIGKYKILGETRDDAAGECFDKCAKILGLSYPGGPIISELADRSPSSIKLPRPMINTKDYDFSFSGLKTAVLYHHKKQAYSNFHGRENLSISKYKQQKQYKREMASEIQQAIIDVLLKKTIKAAKDFNVKSIILGGGVSANEELRKQLKEKIKKEIPNTQYLTPSAQLSTDNAVMTAIAGYFNQKKKISCELGSHIIKAEANLRIGKT